MFVYIYSGDDKLEFIDLWNDICDKNLELHLSDRTLASLLSRNWIDIAADYVKTAWKQLLQSKDKERRENLKRSCVVSGILLFLFESSGPSIQEKDQILERFLDKIDLWKYGYFLEENWSPDGAIPWYIQHTLYNVKKKNLYVCHFLPCIMISMISVAI